MKKILVQLARRLGIYNSLKRLKYRFGFHPTFDPIKRSRLVALFSTFLKKGDLCFDIGANVGEYTASFLDLGADVVSVEPQPIGVKRLKRLFGSDSHVVIVPAACGEQEGKGEIHICEYNHAISTMSAAWQASGRFTADYEWRGKVTVAIITLDALIAKYGCPDFCKIDVEGFEFQVLSGLSQKIRALSFEFTHEFLAEAELCLVHLNDLGPIEFNFCRGDSYQLEFFDWQTDIVSFLRHLREGFDSQLCGDIFVRFL